MQATANRLYPTDALSERIADGTIHAIGVLAAVAGAVVLIFWATVHAPPEYMTAIAIYGGTLIASFAASAIYHVTPWDEIRPILRRVDHAAIYLKIAGTYTPFVIIVGHWFAYLVLAIVWLLALIGMVFKLFYWCPPGKYGPVLYLVMGWLGLALVWSLWPIVPAGAMVLMCLGGLLYTAGLPFFASNTMKYSTAIWHAFVLKASSCFFAAIWMSVAALAAAI